MTKRVLPARCLQPTQKSVNRRSLYADRTPKYQINPGRILPSAAPAIQPQCSSARRVLPSEFLREADASCERIPEQRSVQTGLMLPWQSEAASSADPARGELFQGTAGLAAGMRQHSLARYNRMAGSTPDTRSHEYHQRIRAAGNKVPSHEGVITHPHDDFRPDAAGSKN